MNKLIVIVVAVFFYTIGFSQTNNKKVYKKQGDLVSVTTYYENGSIKEHGFYKDKKLHGEWNMYNEKGRKIVNAHYKNGVKTGVWTFLKNGVLSKVNYSNNKITGVNTINAKQKIALQ